MSRTNSPTGTDATSEPVTAPRDEFDALLDAWSHELPELVGPQLTLLKRLAKLQALVEEVTRAELTELGLTYAEFDVLASLRRAGAP